MATAINPAASTASSVDEAERRAFNRAFRELLFTWYWDIGAYRGLLGISDLRERVRHFLEAEHPAVLEAYPVEFLVNLVCETQQRQLKESFPYAATPLRGWAPAMHSTESIA